MLQEDLSANCIKKNNNDYSSLFAKFVLIRYFVSFTNEGQL